MLMLMVVEREKCCLWWLHRIGVVSGGGGGGGVAMPNIVLLSVEMVVAVLSIVFTFVVVVKARSPW